MAKTIWQKHINNMVYLQIRKNICTNKAHNKIGRVG